MEKKKFTMPFALIAATTWFGYHCGSGFASGKQVYVYAIKYGKFGLLAPVIAWVCCGIFLYIIAEYARLVQAKSYRDVASTIYWNNATLGKIVILVWDLMVFASMIVASGACVAGAGTLINELFGLPYFVGCALFVALIVLIMCVGEGALNRLGKISTPLIVLFFLVCISGIVKGFPNLVHVLTTDAGAPIVETTPMNILDSGFTYACIQISFVHTMCVIGGKFKSKRETQLAIGAGVLMNMGAMLVSCLAILAFYPEITSAAMPTLDIVRNVGGAWGAVLMVVYNFVLVMAYITTAGALIEGGIARYRPLLTKAVKSDFAAKIIIVLAVMLGASLLSTLGLEGVVTKAYGFLSNLRKPIWFFPIIILGPIAIYRFKKGMSVKKAAESNLES